MTSSGGRAASLPPAQLKGGGKLTCSWQQGGLGGTSPGKARRLVLHRDGMGQGRWREAGEGHCPAHCAYLARGDLSAGRARKSQRKMASPTLMTCCWSGVKATWRTGS